jgi:diguanylate cyclase (GGDEF)-like protein/PAS domain S-box-containing protein
MMFDGLRRMLAKTLRRQLVVGMVLVVSATMTLFIWDLTQRQKTALLELQIDQAQALSRSVATSAAVWLAARDYGGLQEIVQGLSSYPDLQHAIILDTHGLILAHSEAAREGQYLSDLPQRAELALVGPVSSMVDVASPVLIAGQHIGWVRIGLGRHSLDAKLAGINRGGVIYALIAMLLSAIFSTLAARHLTRRLRAIQHVADAVRAGASGLRANVSGEDEAAQLALQFNHMLDSLAQREEAQKQSESLFRAVFDNAAVGIAQLSIDGQFLQINQAFCEIIGYSRDEILTQGLAFQQITFADDLARDLENVNKLLRNELSRYDVEKRYVRRDGELVWVSLSAILLRTESGEPLYFISAAQDITVRKRAYTEQRIAAIAFESQIGMMVTDAQQEILRVNQAFSQITGYSAQEAMGHKPHLLSSGHHDRAFYNSMWETIVREGAWQGEIWNRRKDGEVFPEWLTITSVKDNDGVTTHYVSTFTDISSLKNAQDQINTLAFYDPLTRLPNRRLLMDRLEQLLAAGTRHQRRSALLFVDLDNFKSINDTQGHYQGDLLLEQVAQRLSTCVREGDTVARLGGDEFVVMLENLSEDEMEAAKQAETVGNKILLSLNQIYQLGDHTHHSTPSIGVTLIGGDPHEGIAEPLKRADLAMYQAKAAGRNTLRFFDPQMQAQVMARVALEAGLREALEQGQFALHYQPQITGEYLVTGVEALVRWQHPQRGLVSPAEFIPLAEETGLIIPLGQWVLRTACAQLERWAVQPELRELTVAVNVSARQFHQDGFVDQVLSALSQAGANPQRLKLELTESLLLSNVEQTILKMNALKDVGVGFSLDDFGTGYSSLAYLSRFRPNKVKIDQSFVRDMSKNGASLAII